MPSYDAVFQGEERSTLQAQIPQKRGKRIWDLIWDLAHEVRSLAHEVRNLAHEVRNLADLPHRVRLLESRQDEMDYQPASWSNDGISCADCRDKGYRDEENLDF